MIGRRIWEKRIMGKNKKKKQQNIQTSQDDSKLSKEARIALEKKAEKKEIFLMAVFLVAGIAIVAMALWKLSGAGNDPSRKVVFKVGEEAVYLDEVNLCILQNMMNLGITEEMLNSDVQEGGNADEYYKNEILQLIMDYKVEAKIAKKQGISLSEEERKSIRSDAVEYMGVIDGHILKQLGITQDRLIEIYTERYLAHALEKTVTKDIEVDEQRFCTMYMLLFPKVEIDENGNYITQEDGETPVVLSDEAIEKKKEDAQKAYKELKDGADIEEIADKYEVAAVSGEESNLAESFGEPFSEYAEKLKAGEYSPVLETASCFAILKMVRENNEELAQQIFEDYKSDLEKETLDENKVKWYEEAGINMEADFVGNTWENISLYDFVQYVEE